MKEASCPIFIAAPFIAPSVSTSRSADASAAPSMRSRRFSLERTTPVALAPANRAPSAPARMPSFAERARRLLGIARSLRVVGHRDKLAWRARADAASPLESAADGGRRENPADARAARGARLAGEPAAAPRRASCPASIYGAGADSVSFKVDARRLRAVLAEGHALFDVEIDGSERQPVIVKDQQRDPVRGPGAAPRPAEGPPRREDPVDGGARDRGRRGRARRERGRRARARHARAERERPADRHPRPHRRRRLRARASPRR